MEWIFEKSSLSSGVKNTQTGRFSILEKLDTISMPSWTASITTQPCSCITAPNSPQYSLQCFTSKNWNFKVSHQTLHPAPFSPSAKARIYVLVHDEARRALKVKAWAVSVVAKRLSIRKMVIKGVLEVLDMLLLSVPSLMRHELMSQELKYRTCTTCNPALPHLSNFAWALQPPSPMVPESTLRQEDSETLCLAKLIHPSNSSSGF